MKTEREKAIDAFNQIIARHPDAFQVVDDWEPWMADVKWDAERRVFYVLEEKKNGRQERTTLR